MHDQRHAPSATRRLAASLALVSLVLTLGLGAMGAAPEPDPVPVRWEFEFKNGPLRVTTVDVPGLGPRKYLFQTFQVTNYSGRDLLFAPAFDLKTDEAEVLRSGRNVPRAVTEEILRRLDNPLLQDQISILGQILQGVENARDGVVIWPLPDTDVDELMVFGAGFSGENKPYVVRNGKTGKSKRFVLRKTVMLRYSTPGSLLEQDHIPLELVEKRWVMR